MRARRSGRSCSRSNLPWLGSSVSERMEAPAQLVGEQIGHFERSKVSASIKLIPVEQLRIDLRRPASRRRQVVRKHADRKSTRLNSSHLVISYAVFCLKKKRKPKLDTGADL